MCGHTYVAAVGLAKVPRYMRMSHFACLRQDVELCASNAATHRSWDWHPSSSWHWPLAEVPRPCCWAWFLVVCPVHKLVLLVLMAEPLHQAILVQWYHLLAGQLMQLNRLGHRLALARHAGSVGFTNAAACACMRSALRKTAWCSQASMHVARESTQHTGQVTLLTGSCMACTTGRLTSC
jgi:hypothetical protein